jgi:hypothetical protein
MTEINYGISGAGSVSAHNVVVGPSGSIVENATTIDLRERLADLRRAVTAYDGPAETQAVLSAATDDVQRELERPQPDKRTLAARLRTLTEAAGSASAVAAAATALIQLAGVVL